VGLYDVLARCLFALWQLCAVSHGASLLLLGFTVMELAFAVAQSLPVIRTEVAHREAFIPPAPCT
jgi:hypothetical protein